MEHGEVTMEPIGDTLARLAANPDECAVFPFPASGLQVVLHSAGDGEWDMITRTQTHIISMDKVTEDSLLFRLEAATTMEEIVGEIKARKAAPDLVTDVEAFLASQTTEG